MSAKTRMARELAARASDTVDTYSDAALRRGVFLLADAVSTLADELERLARAADAQNASHAARRPMPPRLL